MLLNSPLLLPALPGAAAQLLVARGAEDQTQHSLCESSTAPSTLTQPELASLFFLPAASPPPLHLPTALLIFRAEAASRGALYRAAAGHENQEIDSEAFVEGSSWRNCIISQHSSPLFSVDGSEARCPPPPFAPCLLADGFDQEPRVAPPAATPPSFLSPPSTERPKPWVGERCGGLASPSHADRSTSGRQKPRLPGRLLQAGDTWCPAPRRVGTAGARHPAMAAP